MTPSASGDVAGDLEDRHARVREILADVGAKALLATDHASVRWLLGRETQPGVAVLVTVAGILEVCGGLPRQGCPEEFELADPIGHCPVAVETTALPSTFRDALQGHPLVDVAGPLASLRLVHSSNDLIGIRAAAAVASRGQRLLREQLTVGLSEEELFIWLDHQLRQDGTVMTSIVDLMFGARCARVGLPPTSQRLTAGDTVIFDFAPLLDGFWSDSCTTSVLGPVPRGVRRAHDYACRALEVGISMVRPGQTVGAIDRAVREVMDGGGYPAYPHMTGHGIGYKQQDFPLFHPESQVLLETGAVIAIEPGAYLDDFGVRVEHVMLVDDSGATLLTTHDLALTPH